MMRRATTSGRQAIALRAPLIPIHSSTRAQAFARAMADCAARRCRSHPKPNRAAAQSSDGGVISQGDTHSPDKEKGSEINLASARGVGSAQVLRRNHQPVGLAEGGEPADDRICGDAANKAAK